MSCKKKTNTLLVSRCILGADKMAQLVLLLQFTAQIMILSLFSTRGDDREIGCAEAEI